MLTVLKVTTGNSLIAITLFNLKPLEDENEVKEEGSFLKPGTNKGVVHHLSATTERTPRKYYTSQPWRNLYRDD